MTNKQLHYNKCTTSSRQEPLAFTDAVIVGDTAQCVYMFEVNPWLIFNYMSLK